MLSIEPTAAERAAALPGDDLVAHPDVVMDRAFDLPAAPAEVWPWLLQLGKGRGGWYLTRGVERLMPRGRRGLRRLDDRWQGLAVGDVIPDWGGRDATFEVAALVPGEALVHRSTRGRTSMSWALVLRPAGSATRVQLRLRLGPVRHRVLAERVGGAFDRLTVLGLAAGMNERLDLKRHR